MSTSLKGHSEFLNPLANARTPSVSAYLFSVIFCSEIELICHAWILANFPNFEFFQILLTHTPHSYHAQGERLKFYNSNAQSEKQTNLN